jgi:hypothetical protein
MTQNRSTSLSVAALAVVQTALFAVPMIVLGQAIGWPASLRLPTSEILPLIHANAGAVSLGYWAYLIVSVALIPLAFAFRQWFTERGLGGHWLDAATFIGAAAGVLKTLGIVRWLIAMPTLAVAHAQTSDPLQRQIIETVATGLNAYGGSIGELLGVQLMSGLWLAFVGVGLLRVGRPIVGAIGAIVGALFLILCLRTVMPGIDALQMVAVPLALVWFLILAGTLVRRP